MRTSPTHRPARPEDDAALWKLTQSDPEEICVDLVLDILAASQDETTTGGVTFTRDEVRHAIAQEQGDIDRAVNELMSLMAVRALQEENNQNEELPSEWRAATTLQWQELCSGLGLTECDSFFKVLESMPEEERDATLSADGGFFQQLLLTLDEEEAQPQVEGEGDDDDEHPLTRLQKLFPHTKMNVIEDVFESQGFDLNATAVALENIQSLDNVHSFASVIKANKSRSLVKSAEQAAMESRYSDAPSVTSLGHFPVLPAKSKQHKRNRRGPETNTSSHTGPWLNAWNTTHHGQTKETKLTTQLKLERLHRLLPTIDRDVIQTTFYLNGCSSNATEAALRQIFNLPVPENTGSASGNEPEEEEEEEGPVVRRSAYASDDNLSYEECRARVDNCWQNLSDRYCSALDSFNRNHRIIANDRVRDISRARQALREAQHEAAHAFVESHRFHIRQQRPLDLHGLTVLEALRVSREVVEICRAERIRRCLLIVGVGNHSINQKARLLSAIQLSLERRQISFRKESGMLVIFPLRSPS
ncbi:hypothetical protein Poli38472_007735 [Pythium oligandrum]|uniref:Smr domain-containing protein n=1 Tax=Pythium oligandrum TaxID=41045 RepID=A0A8K1CTM0_PYTOL|nr:hypothetical protein Poli38472_007735 [Pythium oligandrum]|eukprot:TMW68063.1 hypothetical protein Poli38472_007735 [Pythium oligandrum]